MELQSGSCPRAHCVSRVLFTFLPLLPGHWAAKQQLPALLSASSVHLQLFPGVCEEWSQGLQQTPGSLGAPGLWTGVNRHHVCVAPAPSHIWSIFSRLLVVSGAVSMPRISAVTLYTQSIRLQWSQYILSVLFIPKYSILKNNCFLSER